MNKEWHHFRLSDLCMSLWQRVTEDLSYSERPYTYTVDNYVFVANRKKTISELIELFSTQTSIAGQTITDKLRGIYE